MKAFFEKVSPLDASSFQAYFFENEEFDSPWHYHPEYELTYILSSSGVRYVGNHFESFREGDLVLLGPNLPHCWKNSGIQTGKASSIVIYWNEELLGKDWMKKNKFENIQRLLLASGRGIKFDHDLAAELKEDFLGLLTLTPFEKLISLLKIIQRLADAEGATGLCENAFQTDYSYGDQERINAIFQFVKENYHQKISLASVAATIYLSDESFSRFFSNFLNKPFFTFLNEYRINAACNMLIESGMPVTEISLACGFESLPFFYRQFKKYKGCSPRHFQLMYQRIIKE